LEEENWLTVHQGSDHCPVYAILKEKVSLDGKETYISDVVNPPGMFEDGKRKEQWSTKNLLPISGKLIPEFDRRRNIRDMFSRKPSLSSQKSFAESEEMEVRSPSTSVSMAPPPLSNSAETVVQSGETSAVSIDHAVVASPARSAGFKRAQKPEAAMPPAKRTKSGPQSAGTNGSGKGQQSLKGFFQARSLTTNGSNSTKDTDTVGELPPQPTTVAMPTNDSQASVSEAASSKVDVDTQREPGTASGDLNIIPTIDEASAEASKQSWGKLFSKPASPNCEHGEPCKTMLTKKPGVNCGRSFWMCNRPLGPSGSKEKNTQWRCSTFIWASDWTGTGNG
jgi:AP endonuclease-2